MLSFVGFHEFRKCDVSRLVTPPVVGITHFRREGKHWMLHRRYESIKNKVFNRYYNCKFTTF